MIHYCAGLSRSTCADQQMREGGSARPAHPEGASAVLPNTMTNKARQGATVLTSRPAGASPCMQASCTKLVLLLLLQQRQHRTCRTAAASHGAETVPIKGKRRAAAGVCKSRAHALYKVLGPSAGASAVTRLTPVTNTGSAKWTCRHTKQ